MPTSQVLRRQASEVFTKACVTNCFNQYRYTTALINNALNPLYSSHSILGLRGPTGCVRNSRLQEVRRPDRVTLLPRLQNGPFSRVTGIGTIFRIYSLESVASYFTLLSLNNNHDLSVFTKFFK